MAIAPLPDYADVDWGDPITKGLRWLVVPAVAGKNNLLHRGAVSQVEGNGPRLARGPHGQALHFATSANGGTKVPTQTVGNQYTVFSFQSMPDPADTSDAHPVDNDPDNSNRHFQHRCVSSGIVQFIAFTNGASPTVVTGPTLTGAQRAAGWTQTSRIGVDRVPRLMVNGSTTTAAALATVKGGTSSTICVGGYSRAGVAGSPANLRMYVAAVWDRCLTEAEDRRLHKDPFCFLRSRPRRVSVYVAGTTDGAGTADGTGAATGTGAAIFSGVGAADGTGAAAGVGASTAAGDGAADGTGAAAGVGASTAASEGASTGLGDAAGVGTSTAEGVGAADGLGAATGIADSPAVGAADGTGAATGVGTGIGSGSGAADGLSDALGVGVAIFSGTGASAGTGEPLAVGASTFAGVGLAAGVGTALGITPTFWTTRRLVTVMTDQRSLISLPDTRMLEIPINRQNEA